MMTGVEKEKTKAKPSICFVALNAYNVISGKSEESNHIGGAEVQQCQIAQWLVKKGYKVCFVTLDHGQPDEEEVNGVKIFKSYIKNNGVRGLRFIHPRWSGLCSAMARANSDIYYYRGAANEAGQVALWCAIHKKKYIFALASDKDCRPWKAVETIREKILYWIGLKLAYVIIAQSFHQQDLLKRYTGDDTILVRSCGREAADPSVYHRRAFSKQSFRILWIGRIAKQKRFDRLLKIAEQCSKMEFDVIGAPNEEDAYSRSLIQRAASLNNVNMLGRIPYQQMDKYYQRSDLLCCTSEFEGFPNVFLEAWRLGLPVISTIDPDGIVKNYELGWVAEDVHEIVEYLLKLKQFPDLRQRASEKARLYYELHHLPKNCLPKFEQTLQKVASSH